MSAVDCRLCDDAEGWRALPGLDRIVDDLAEQIPELLARHHVPGLAIGVCDRSGVLWAKGFGGTRAEGGKPVTPSTMFSIQSCSKMYTAAVVMVAVERGLVGLDRPITAYLPEFTVNSCFEGPAQDKITLRHLLGHTAGFTHEAPEGSNFLIGAGSFPAHCRSISDTWLRFPVGHHYEYSNLGIDLAGWAVARMAGAAFPEVARRWLFAPLGLSRTTFAQRVITQEEHRAVGHDRRYKRVATNRPGASRLETCRGERTTGQSILRPTSGKPIDRRDASEWLLGSRRLPRFLVTSARARLGMGRSPTPLTLAFRSAMPRHSRATTTQGPPSTTTARVAT